MEQRMPVDCVVEWTLALIMLAITVTVLISLAITLKPTEIIT